LDWILSFFVSLDDQIARISRARTCGLCRDSGSVHATLFRGNGSWNAARI